MAGGLGYCGLERRRSPLVGDEIRACWEAAPTGSDPLPGPSVVVAVPPMATTAPPARGFVDIDATPAEVTATADRPAGSEAETPVAQRPPSPETGWSLWAELEG